MDPTQENNSGGSYQVSLDDLGPEGQMPQTASVDAETAGFAPETVDLLDTLTDAEQQVLADDVTRTYERDWRSSEKFRERRTSIVKLFLGILPATDDEDGSIGSAAVHYPIIATAIQRMHARIYDQQFPANGEFFGVKPQDADDIDRAMRVAKHLNWQVMHKIPEYVMNHDVLIMQWLLYGSAFSYMYWDPVRNRPCHEVCRTEDIVIPYTFGGTDPSMADVPRITRILRKYRHEMEELAEAGYYKNIDAIDAKEDQGQSTGGASDGGFTNVSSATGGQSMRDVIDRAQGIDKPLQDGDGAKDGPRVLLEQHRWWKFAGEKRQRPVIATVDKDTKILIGLRLREDEDPQDRARYNREMAANRASYDAAMQQYQMDMANYVTHAQGVAAQGPLQSMPMALPTAQGADMTQPPAGGEMTSTEPGMSIPAPQGPPPPMPPPQPESPTPPRMVPINFFTHYVCIPNPEGLLGFGIGYLLEGHNMVADTIASQIIDAGTLANSSTFLYSRQAKLNRGEFRIRPGEGVETGLSPQDLDKGIKILSFPGPDAALASMIKDQKEEAAELSGANEILSGEVGGSNETATTTQIRISQALAAISILNKRYTRARTFEGSKLARLNSVHLDDKEYFTVVDPFKTVPPTISPPPPPMGQQPMNGQPPAPPPVPGPAAPGPGTPGGPAAKALPGPPQPPPGFTVPPGMPAGPPPPVIREEFVARIDYLEDVDIIVTADPRMSSQPQRVQEAQGVMAAINSNPYTAQMPQLVLAGMKLYFTALDKPEMTAAMEQAAMMMAMQPPPPPGKPAHTPPPKGGGGAPQPSPEGVSNEPFMGQGQ